MAIRQVQEGCFTYQDWLNLEYDESVRVELIDGTIYFHASPNTRHQGLLGEIAMPIANYLKGKRCQLYIGLLAVRLEEDTVVVPDIIVVCDPKKLTEAGAEGAPDLIVEILCPSTQSHDRATKFNLYKRAGVTEYWIVDPEDNTLTIHRLEDDKYFTDVLNHKNTATVSALPGFELDLSAVFAENIWF